MSTNKNTHASNQPAPPKRKVLFVLSVDTEEEFDWNGEFPQQNCSVRNVQKIPEFQAFCESLSIRPTYLVDYPVANDPASAAILSTIAQSGQAEIGAHLHPWCTPPFEGGNSERESHVINLPSDLVQRKLSTLTATIKTNIGINPKAFRTGRWGTDAAILKVTLSEGYHIDSSVYPYYSNEYFSCHHPIGTPYWPSLRNPNKAGSQQNILEIPVTAGFNRPNFPFWEKIHNVLSSNLIAPLHLVALAWSTKTLRKLYLSPELSTTADMATLIDAAVNSHHPVIHMYLHSSSLLPGHNEFTRNDDDQAKFYKRIQHTVEHLTAQTDVTFCTLSEVKSRLQSGFSGYCFPTPSD
ncbi:MAG: polysaccharide deacetylase family protein [Pseudomonadales bacterium]|nr:polysaccharide deacetylase family protein [Pseudomonadales bacterium]